MVGKMNLHKPVVIAFLLIIVSSATYAAACDVAMSFFRGDVLTDTWGFRAAIAIGLSMIVVALFYMIGKGVGSPEIVNRAKTDLNQVLVSAVILVLFGAFVGGICAIDATQFGLPKASLFDNARAYFDYSISKCIEAYVKTANSIMVVSGLSSVFTRVTLLTNYLGMDVSVTIMPFAGLNSALNSLQFMMNMVLTTVAISSAWLAVLNSIETAFLQLLLPIGVLLRCFMPTRELGGIFIALSIGLFVFYPLLFSLSYLMIGAPAQVDEPSTSYYGTLTSAYWPIALSGIIPFAGVPVVRAEYRAMSDKTSEEIIDSLESIGGALLAVFILPAINWIVLAELVRSMSRSLGEEIDISTLARIV